MTCSGAAGGRIASTHIKHTSNIRTIINNHNISHVIPLPDLRRNQRSLQEHGKRQSRQGVQTSLARRELDGHGHSSLRGSVHQVRKVDNISFAAITKLLTLINSLQQFQEATFARLGKIMKPPGIRLMVRNVIGGGDQEWATVELVAVAECKSGTY